MAKKKTKGTITLIGILACGIYGAITGDTETARETSNTNEKSIIEESQIVLSDIEIFSQEMSDSSEFVSYQTAENLYNFLKNDLLFEDISFKNKNEVGNILFDVAGDNFLLMISVDNDGIYSVRCGGYDLYDGNSVLMTKTGLDDRSTKQHESSYYSIAKLIIEDNLKSPKTAEFPSLWSGEIKMQRNKDIVCVQSYVDAENSFGAMIRNKWVVEFRIIDIETYSYEILYINIDGEEAGEYIELD